MNALKLLFQVSLFLLPWSLRRRILNLIPGYEIDRRAVIGFSIVMARSVRIAEGCRIGHGTVIRGLELLRLDRHSFLGHLNWVSGFPLGAPRFFIAFPDRYPALVIGEHAAILNRNMIDCTDRISIGAFSVIAGNRNQLITHGLVMRTANQSCAPLSVGRYCMIGSGSILLKGSSLADFCALGAGSVLHKAQTATHTLFSGVPAVPVKPLEPDMAFFHRIKGESD